MIAFYIKINNYIAKLVVRRKIISLRARALAPLHPEAMNMEVSPVELLAKYVTPLATIYAYEGSVRLSPRKGRKRDLTISGRILENLYGNQEFLVPFTEISGAYRMIGSSVPTPGMGGTFAHLVVDKDGDGFYQLGYEHDGVENLVDLDSQGLLSLIGACRVAMRPRGSFHYDKDFWVVYVALGLCDVSVTSQDITVDPDGIKPPIRIKQADEITWRKCFAAVDELRRCERGSQVRVATDVVLYKPGDNSYSIKWESPDGDILVFGGRSLFSGLRDLVAGFWCTADDDYWEDDDLVDVDEDDEDYDEGGVS